MTQTILVETASQNAAKRRPRQLKRRAAPANARSIALLAAGFERTEPPILHPAAIFLDMSGEEVRRRLFLTADAAGEELCLRPEYTIPVCRAYLGSDKAGKIAEYSYLGPVFRARAGQVGEQTQTGLESFGRRDAEAADAEVFSLAMEAATAAGGGRARGAARRRRPVRRHAQFAENSRAVAPASAPGRRPRAEPRGHFQPPEPERARPAWRAGGAGERRSRRRQGSGRGPAGDRRHRCGRRPQRERDRRPLSGTGVAPRRGRRSKRRSARCWTPSSPFPAIRTKRRSSFGAWRSPPASTWARRWTRSSGATASSPPAAWRSRRPGSAPPSCAISTITPASCSRPTIPMSPARGPRSPAGVTTGSRRRLGANEDIPAVGAAIKLDRLMNGSER